MLNLITREDIWDYFSTTQRDLILEGKYLMDITDSYPHKFKDYSFLVFPFAKAYEGFLKQLFLDVDFISHLDYISDHFRLGKYLSPHLVGRLGERSLYSKIIKNSSEELANKIWNTWKYSRNEIFHYYPHNIKRVTQEEAKEMNEDILHIMVKAYKELKAQNSNVKIKVETI